MMNTYEPISGIETLDAQGRVLYCETDGLGDPCIVIGAANGEEEITVALPGMALCRVVDDGNLTMLQRAHRALQAAQSGNPEADLFYQDVALYAQIAQAEAAERQAAALERIAQLMETQEADRQADLRREEMRAEWAARAANPGY